jgi:hypothetical protein
MSLGECERGIDQTPERARPAALLDRLHWDAVVVHDDCVARINQRVLTTRGTLIEPTLEIGLDCQAARTTECDPHEDISS